MTGNIVQNIIVEAATKYLPEHPAAKQAQYAFAYEITIKNQSEQSVKLLNRYWLITNADGKKTEVKGAGVVGEQPLIPSGESYQYNSGAVLDTPVGAMEGYYEMQLADGEMVTVPIRPFSLAVPNAIN